jgi:peptidoglycan hydrolase-like protein with peptidoglycan-binding domain
MSLELLTKLADKLDAKGMFEEANAIDEFIRNALGPNPKVLQWQQNYNKKNNLKPGTPGFLPQDGISGPATQEAMKKSKEMELAKQVYTDPRKQHYDINKSNLTPPK